jgi:hypothetical protein
MAGFELLRQRLFNQQLTRPRLEDPAAVVAWLGAVQAQDYFGARWALGQRLVGATDAALEQAFEAGAFLRTHVMRPTWHFVAPADLRWLLKLTAPRVHRANGSMYRRYALDAALFKRADRVLTKALRDGQHRTRPELDAALQDAGITRDGVGLAYIIMHAELEGLVCSGPRRGKQFTYALLEERVPPAPALTDDEALAELARRYFQSHGPAQAPDFAWWSGLTMAECRRGAEAAEPKLARETIDGKDYWFYPAEAPPIPREAFLLPNYDEYGIAYKDRAALSDPRATWQPGEGDLRGYPHLIALGGPFVGIWKRVINTDSVHIEARLLHPPSASEKRAVAAAAVRYAGFLGMPVTVAWGEA